MPSDALNRGAQGVETADEVLVTTVDVGDIPDFGDPVGGQTGQDQGRSGPDVGRQDGAAGQTFHASDDGVLCLD